MLQIKIDELYIFTMHPLNKENTTDDKYSQYECVYEKHNWNTIMTVYVGSITIIGLYIVYRITTTT